MPKHKCASYPRPPKLEVSCFNSVPVVTFVNTVFGNKLVVEVFRTRESAEKSAKEYRENPKFQHLSDVKSMDAFVK